MTTSSSSVVASRNLTRRGVAFFTLAALAACAASTSSAPPPPAPARVVEVAAAPPVVAAPPAPAGPQRLNVLFIGSGGPHAANLRLRDVASPLLDRGIGLLYSEDRFDLTIDRLRRFDAVVLYGDPGNQTGQEGDALAEYVNGGGGLVAIHSAAAEFQASQNFGALLGGRAQANGSAAITTRVAAPEHEIMRGLAALEGTDETFQLAGGTPDRQVLEFRGDQPQTWVRTQGQGRVFYTAWGHDGTTWRNPAFLDLLERGILWAAGEDVQRSLALRGAPGPFAYDVLDVPFPPPHRVRLEYEASTGLMDRAAANPRFYSMQKPLDPEDAIHRMILPPGFHVELFASEPDIVNPISMTWDERGRLWVVESIEYPYPRAFWPDGGGKDRILILEDTNGDWRADSFKVFAENLNIPTGITFANGGIIISQAPDFLFLKDTNGDDKADVRQVLFTGWSQRDTHAGPSHLFYGLDNWIWGTVGYSGFAGRVGPDSINFLQGVYRFKQDGSKLELLRATSNNTWGLGFNEQGGAFISTANGNPSTYLPYAIRYTAGVPTIQNAQTDPLIPDPRYLPISNEFRQVDWVGAFTAGAGHALYTGRNYPREYWNRIAFVAEPTGHLVGEVHLRTFGSSYRADQPKNFLVSDDQWFSPVAAEVGPDGQIWIADWYNYVAQHNAESSRQSPSLGNAYANPLRDRSHGRIYRVVYEGPQPQPMSLAGATPDRLVATLKNDNLLWRKHAQRLLVERGQADVAPALIALVNDPSVDATGINVGAIHALWTLKGLGQLDGANPAALAAARGALRHQSAGVRRNAVQVMPADAATVEGAITTAGLLSDQDPQVVLETLLAISAGPASTAAGRAIFEFAGRPGALADRWIREAATAAAVKHAEGFLGAATAAGVTGAAAAGAGQPAPANLIPNATFTASPDSRTAQGWNTVLFTGTADMAFAPGAGRNGGNALTVTAPVGADVAWMSQPITLEPNTRYEIGIWVKLENLKRVNGVGRGAQVEFSTLSIPSRTNLLGDGTRDWAQLTRTFVTGEGTTGSVRISLGGGGNSSGKVWFDGVYLHKLGPEDGATLETFVGQVRRALQPTAPAPTPGR